MKNRKFFIILSIAAIGFLITISIGARQSQQSTGSNHNHQDHTDDVNKRGDQAMGFDHTRTTHHFRLSDEGGSIQVEANDPKDTNSRDQIRMHLHHISMLFSEGNFDIPMFVHDQVPPGVVTMKRLKESIAYKYDETDNGARVIITSASRDAIAAVHDFLRFQIKDHKTGDPMDVSKQKSISVDL